MDFDLKISLEAEGFDKFEESLEKEIQNRMSTFAENIEWVWRQKAAAILDTTRARYLNSLEVSVTGLYTVTVTLYDSLAAAIEKGTDSFDMKPGLLGGRAKRAIPIAVSGGGTAMRTVPFKSKTPQYVYTPKRGSESLGAWVHPGIGKGPGSKLAQQGTPGEQTVREIDNIIEESFRDMFKTESV